MVRRPVVALSGLVAVALAVPLTASATPTAAPEAAPTVAVPGVDARPDPGFGPSARASALDRARNLAPSVAESLGLSRGEDLVARSVEQDADGTQHIRYDRTLSGLEVIGGDLVVHRSAAGTVLGADRASDQPLAAVPTTDPSVSAATAVRAAVGRGALSATRPELVVWAATGVPRLAWRTELTGTDRRGEQVSRIEVVDAASGAVIQGWSQHQEVDGSGRSLYSGTVPLQTVRKNGQFQLRDATRGGSTTVDVFNGEDPPGGYLAGTIFKDADNQWGNGLASNRQSAAVDVHFGTAQTWDYFEDTFGRVGIRGDGRGAKSRVHYAQGLDNAFWDDNCFCMTYGDGGEAFKPLVSLDVAGHEMTHGITSNTAGLIYFGESGGLNEATSDIFGAMVEFRANRPSDPPDYYIGEEITKSAFGTFLRRMDRPSQDGVSYDCWTLNMGADDVHFSSGPANRFFYTLAEGTAPKTIGGLPHGGPTCGAPGFTGIGRQAAAAIWWRALSVYMTSTTGYIDARDATIRAARDLFPTAPARCATVVKAWNAVDVPRGYWTCSGRLNEGASVLGTNPGFEAGNAGWTVGGTTRITDDPNIGFPHSGQRWADFNGRGTTNTSTLSRQVTVPNTATAHLRFDLLVYTEDGLFTEFDTFDVLVNGTKVGETGHWDNRYANNTYIRWDVPMNRWAGDTVTLGFRGVEDFSAPSQFLLDDLTLTPR